MPLPVFLLLEDRPCLLVGGGGIARGKADELVREGARVTVVAPELTAAWRERGPLDVTHHARPFAPGDTAGMRYVFTATGVSDVDDAVAAEARQNGALVNAADRNPSCDFYSAAYVDRGPLRVAIGTGGASPALARAVRLLLERELSPALGALGAALGAARPKLLARYPDFGARARLLSEFTDRALARLSDDTTEVEVAAWIDDELLAEEEAG